MKTIENLLVGLLVLWITSCEKVLIVPVESTNLKFKEFPKQCRTKHLKTTS